MAKGYPERAAPEQDYPLLEDLLSEDRCMVCKRRPRETPRGLCHTCDVALHGEQGTTA